MQIFATVAASFSLVVSTLVFLPSNSVDANQSIYRGCTRKENCQQKGLNYTVVKQNERFQTVCYKVVGFVFCRTMLK